MKRAVVDASVVLRWYLLDEVDGEKAINLLEKHYHGRIELLAPSLLAYEVASGLVIAGNRGRLAQEEVREALESYWSLQLIAVDADRFYKRLPHFSHVYGISTYDASYAAVAELENSLVAARGFGSSDCRCRSHLHRIEKKIWPGFPGLEPWAPGWNML